MSNFDFIKLPKDLIQEKYSDKIKYKDQVIKPERLDRLHIGYYEWIEKLNLPDNKESENMWRMNISSHNIQKIFINPLIKSKYNAELNFAFGGMSLGGCMYYLYVSNDFNQFYFYTMNRWKRVGAFGDYKLAKSYRIIIYRIPYEVYDMLKSQDLYETYLIQNPSGFRFKIMTHRQCLENKIKYLKMNITKNKEIKWN